MKENDMLNKKWLVPVMALMLSSSVLADPPRDRLVPLFVGGVGCVAGWVFYAARGAAWGRPALAAFLLSNTAQYFANNFPRHTKY